MVRLLFGMLSWISMLHSKCLADILMELANKNGLNRSTDIQLDVLQNIINGAENGNIDHIYFLGLLKLYGISVSKNETLAAHYFKEAGQRGNSDAQTAYAVMLMTGNGVEKDDYEAVVWLRKSASNNDVTAKLLLARLLIDGRGVPRDVGGAYRLVVEAAAASNSPESLFQLAMMYEYGTGTATDHSIAARLYEQASDQGHLQAIYHLALMLAYGRDSSVPQNFPQAIGLFEKCSRLAHAPCMYYMGILKMSGQGTQVNYQHALHWFERAADMDDEHVSDKAARAAQELRGLLVEAEETSTRIVDMHRQRSLEK